MVSRVIFEIIPAAPAGALSTTGFDMALFMNAHLNNGAGLLSPETARQMHETVDQQFPGVNSMLLGFYQENYAGQRIIAHGGDTSFFHSNLSLLMDQNIGVYISVNSAGAPSVGAALLRWEFMEKFVNRYYPRAEAAGELVALSTAREHGAAIGGDYESARRSATSPLLAAYFVGQTTVAMLPNGDLVGPGLPNVNGKPKHWREVAPWVWQAVGSDERMSARVDENGRVTAIAFEPLSFAIPSTRAPLASFEVIAVAAVRHRDGRAFAHAAKLADPGADARGCTRSPSRTRAPVRSAHRLASAASFLVVVYIGGWVGIHRSG